MGNSDHGTPHVESWEAHFALTIGGGRVSLHARSWHSIYVYSGTMAIHIRIIFFFFFTTLEHRVERYKILEL